MIKDLSIEWNQAKYWALAAALKGRTGAYYVRRFWLAVYEATKYVNAGMKADIERGSYDSWPVSDSTQCWLAQNFNVPAPTVHGNANSKCRQCGQVHIYKKPKTFPNTHGMGKFPRSDEKITDIFIIGREWFDEVNGNSYTSSQALVKIGSDKDELTRFIAMKFNMTNGYENHYESRVIDAIENATKLSRYEIQDLIKNSTKNVAQTEKSCSDWGSWASFETIGQGE